MKLLIVLTLAVTTANAAILPNAVEQPTFATGRIINGHVANKGEAPYIVSLKKERHFCGGSIINENWVLTAAHCLVFDKFSVIAGLHSRNDESQVQIRQVKSKSQQIPHEKYGDNVGPYDIGLIYIDEPFNLNSVTRDGDNPPVAIVSLPSGKYTAAGKGWLYGWGRDIGGALPNELQKLDADIISYADCKKALPFFAPIHESNLCIYRAGKIEGACNGDSGGPLITKPDGNVELVGIVSWGYTPCKNSKRPSIFTSVQYHENWIQETIGTFYFADNPY